MVDENWETANKRISSRKSELENSMQYHQFVTNCKEFQAWLLDLDKKIKSVVAPNSVAEADAFMSLHQERKAELNGRRETFEKLQKVGENLIAEKHSASDKISSEIEKTAEILSDALCFSAIRFSPTF